MNTYIIIDDVGIAYTAIADTPNEAIKKTTIEGETVRYIFDIDSDLSDML
jgi:hypothetical protein